MTHNLELSHDSPVVKTCNAEVSHEFICDAARQGQRLEIAVKELLVLLSCLLVDVIE